MSSASRFRIGLLLSSVVSAVVPLFARAADEGSITAAAPSPFRFDATELYLPLHTYHFNGRYVRRGSYRLNDHPLGLGLGRSRIDDAGNWHGIYALGFRDSFRKASWAVGYGYKWLVGSPSGWNVGAGATAFLMTRKDIDDYRPFPGVTPLASLGYGRFNLEVTYAPKVDNKGPVLFSWARFQF